MSLRPVRACVVASFCLVALLSQGAFCQHTGQGPHHHGRRRPSWTKPHQEASNRHRSQSSKGGRMDYDDHMTATTAASIAFRRLLFQPSKPRGLIHGIWKASKSTTRGFVLGATSFLTFPLAAMSMMGAGNSSFFGVLGLSLLGAVFGLGATLHGIWHGLYHCFWGLVNFPKSIQSSWRKSWAYNPQTERWEAYSLPDDYASRGDHGNRFWDQGGWYYQLLGVPATASKSQIRRAYHEAAKKWHPDKNPDDGDQFLELHQAYKTLSDDASRAKYDELGDMMMSLPIDPRIYFAVLLDSYASLHPYTGDLPIAQWASALLQSEFWKFDDLHSDEPVVDDGAFVQAVLETLLASKEKEQQRQTEIAVYLSNNVLEPFVSGIMTPLEFRTWANCEAQRTRSDHDGGIGTSSRQQALVGQALLESSRRRRHCCGFLLRRVLQWPRRLVAGARQTAARLQRKRRLFGSSFQLLRHLVANGMVDTPETDDGAVDPAMLIQFLRVVEGVNDLDISNTMDGVTWKLFYDSSVSRQERMLRLVGLEILGEEFVKVAALGDQNNNAPFSAMDDLNRLKLAEYLAHDASPSTVSFENLFEEVNKQLETQGPNQQGHGFSFDDRLANMDLEEECHILQA